MTDRNWDAIVAIYEDKHMLWGSSGGRLVQRWIPMRRAEVLPDRWLFQLVTKRSETVLH